MGDITIGQCPVNGQAHVTVTCLILRQYHMTIWVMKKYLAPRGNRTDSLTLLTHGSKRQ